MTQKTFLALARTHLEQGNACTMLSARLPEGGSYGRVLREPDGSFARIVEARDCTPEQAAVTEVNTGTYVFHVPALLSVLDQLDQDNAQGELYLTDVPAPAQGPWGPGGPCATPAPRRDAGRSTLWSSCSRWRTCWPGGGPWLRRTARRTCAWRCSSTRTTPPALPMKDVMAEVAVYGTPTIKRIYGDWTSPTCPPGSPSFWSVPSPPSSSTATPPEKIPPTRP